MADAEGTFHVPFNARVGVRTAMRVLNSAALVHFSARTGLRARAFGVFDATSGGIYTTARFGTRATCSVVASAPVYWVARMGLRSAFNILMGELELTPPTPLPDRVYLAAGDYAVAGSVAGDWGAPGSLAGDYRTGGAHA